MDKAEGRLQCVRASVAMAAELMRDAWVMMQQLPPEERAPLGAPIAEVRRYTDRALAATLSPLAAIEQAADEPAPVPGPPALQFIPPPRSRS